MVAFRGYLFLRRKIGNWKQAMIIGIAPRQKPISDGNCKDALVYYSKSAVYPSVVEVCIYG